jgi:hypothetical protein
MTPVLAPVIGVLVVGGLLMIIRGMRREVRVPRNGGTVAGAWAG